MRISDTCSRGFCVRRKRMPKKEKGNLLSFSSIRKEKIEEKRRNYERVMFRDILNVYTIVENTGLQPIELIDISRGGMLFQVPKSSDFVCKEGDELRLRMYFASESYLPISVQVVRVVYAIEDGVSFSRYGCRIDKGLSSYEALDHFVQFIGKCAEHGHEDCENLKIYY